MTEIIAVSKEMLNEEDLTLGFYFRGSQRVLPRIPPVSNSTQANARRGPPLAKQTSPGAGGVGVGGGKSEIVSEELANAFDYL